LRRHGQRALMQPGKMDNTLLLSVKQGAKLLINKIAY
jgi:hypothetical protein